MQDALQHTFQRLDGVESKQAGVMRVYLRRAVENRIRDVLRGAMRRRASIAPDQPPRFSDEAAPQYQQYVDGESWLRYLNGLKGLSARERRLIVGRSELGYTYRQLALVEDLPSPDAARMALRRAMIRLSGAVRDS